MKRPEDLEHAGSLEWYARAARLEPDPLLARRECFTLGVRYAVGTAFDAATVRAAAERFFPSGDEEDRAPSTIRFVDVPGLMASAGVLLIAAERQRQRDVEQFDAAHDARHTDQALAWAAACYAAPGRIYTPEVLLSPGAISLVDPWPKDWVGFDKRDHRARERHGYDAAVIPDERHRLRELVYAGALIAAEIDRIQRRRPLSASGRRGGGLTP